MNELVPEEEAEENIIKSVTYIRPPEDNNFMRKTILVYGLPGVQATSVCKALLGNPLFHVRGVLIRDNADIVEHLQEQGIETVVLEIADKGPISITKLKHVFRDVYGVFFVSNDTEPYFVMRREIEIGFKLAEMCERQHVQHVVYSGMDYIYRVTGTRCSRYDGKGEIEYRLKELKVPLTALRMPLTYEYLIHSLVPTREGNDTVFNNIIEPQLEVDVMGSGDIGGVVKMAFERPNVFIGKTISLAVDRVSMTGFVEAMSQIREEQKGQWRYEKIPLKEYQKDKRNNREFAAILDFHSAYAPIRDLRTTAALNPDAKTLTEYIRTNLGQLRKEFIIRQ